MSRTKSILYADGRCYNRRLCNFDGEPIRFVSGDSAMLSAP
ncbi:MULTISPECIES: hypothetical protein [Bacteria]|nr:MULTISPECIES: hypothetical protein [Bacteria]